MTGAGRTGSFLRVGELGVLPDLITMAKAISGGYAPLGAVLIHERVAEALITAGRRLDHVHTHSGHPVSCAVGIAVLDILERDGLVNQAKARGE
jgi:putrescine aminotransferase